MKLTGLLLAAASATFLLAEGTRSPRSLRKAKKVALHREELLFTKQTFSHTNAHTNAHTSGYSTISKFAQGTTQGAKYALAMEMEVVHKTAYWGTVTVGKPAQEFSVIFDTGSGNLIIPSTDCSADGCKPHAKYDKSASSSSKAITNSRDEGSAEITFGTGRISGDFYRDRLCVGDSLCFDANFIAATEETAEPFSETPFDGIMGLGFKDLSMGDGFNIVDDMNGAGQLPQGMFSVYLSDEGESEITFGGFRPELLGSEIVWSNVKIESYWQVGIDDIALNNKPSGLCEGGCQVAVDTGTSMLAGPTSLVDQMQDRVGAKSDCSNFDSLPKLGFIIGDTVLNLQPDDYMDKSDGECSFSLMALDVPPPKGPLFIFGDPFLRRFVTVYDRSGPRVGFAMAKQPGQDNSMAFKDKMDVITKVGGGLLVGNGPPTQGGEYAVDVKLKGGLIDSSNNPTTTTSTTPAPKKDTSPKAPEMSVEDALDAASSAVDGTAPATKKNSDSKTAPAGGDTSGLNAAGMDAVKKMQLLFSHQTQQSSLLQQHSGNGGQRLVSIKLHKSMPTRRHYRKSKKHHR
jgi:pepsin A